MPKQTANDVYVFALCSPDSRYPDQRNWYLKVTDEDKYMIPKFYEMFIVQQKFTYGQNPHHFNSKTRTISDVAMLFNPSILAVHWITSVMKILSEFGVVYIGSKGQLFTPRPDAFVSHSEKSCPELSFPKQTGKELIKIFKWKSGSHFYITSSIGRIFTKEKFDTFQEAFNEASKHVSDDRIEFHRPKI